MLSIIIPTYNEEKNLGILLRSLKPQSKYYDEIIIADNFSRDKTVSIAKKFGCKVVKGGSPAEGRNAGIKAAASDKLLFMDADISITRNLLKDITSEYKNNSVATAWFKSREKNLLNILVCLVANLTKKINLIFTRKLNFLIGEYGLFIMCERAIFKKIGYFKGLDAYTFEDTFFFRKAINSGFHYQVLPAIVSMSDRRLRNKNIFQLSFWGLLCGLIVLITLFKPEVNTHLLALYKFFRSRKY
jgi:glycosyltransferase involved in cell wall biosynthesis